MDNTDSDFDEFEVEEFVSTVESQEEGDSETEDDSDDEENAKQLNSGLKWKIGQFSPVIHNFNDSDSGFRSEFCGISSASTYLDFFECFVRPELTGKIAFETNRYIICTKYTN